MIFRCSRPALLKSPTIFFFLLKPGRIKEIDFSLSKLHPQVGFDILKDVELPWPIAQIVVEHHEKVDGSGYPKGIAESNLLVESRIMAVADGVPTSFGN